MIKHCWRRSELVVENEKHLAAASWGHFLPIHTVLPSSISRRPAASWHLLPHACLDFFISLSFSSNQAPTCLLPAFLPLWSTFSHPNFDLQFSHKVFLGLFPFFKLLCGRTVFGILWDIFRPLAPGPLFRVPSAPPLSLKTYLPFPFSP